MYLNKCNYVFKSHLSAIYVVISQSTTIVKFLSFVIGQNVDINKACHL
jgi:hypothetical protein